MKIKFFRNNLKFIITWITLTSYSFGLLTPLFLFPEVALADGANTGGVDVLSIDAGRARQGAEVNCDTVCNLMVGSSDGKGGYLEASVGGDGGSWGKTDDLYCANHGVTTDRSVTPSGNVASTTPDCNVPLSAEDGSGTDACGTASKKLLHCKLHGGQAFNQCLAYKSANPDSEAAVWNKVCIAMDATAAAVCGAACAGLVAAGPASLTMCAAAGAAAGAAQIVGMTKTSQSGVAQVVSGLAIGGGVAAGGYGMMQGLAGRSAGKNAKGLNNSEQLDYAEQQDKAGDLTKAPADKDEAAARDKLDGYDKKNADAKSKAQEEQNEKGKKAACAAAAVFAIMMALRIKDLKTFDESKDSACNSVRSLLSSSSVTAPGGLDQNYSNYTPGNGGLTLAGTTSAATSGATGNNSGYTSSNSGGATRTYDTSIFRNQGQTGAALDANALNQSGLPNVISPAADSLLANGLDKMLHSGATAGQVMGSALGMVGGAGNVGQGLAALAELTQQNPKDARDLLPPGALPAAATYGGGGGGGSSHGGGGGGGDNPFAAFMGGGPAAGGALTGPSVASFEKKQSTDIWHAGTSATLFEIISGKIVAVSNRVHQFEPRSLDDE